MAKSQKPPQPPRQRNASRYKRSETSRLVQGALDAGLTVRGIEVDPATGVLCILTEFADGEAGDTDLDRELKDWEERRGRQVSHLRGTAATRSGT